MKRINGNNSNNSNNSSNNSNTEFWINMYTSNTSLSLELSSPDDQRGRMFEQQRPPNKRNKKIRKVNLDMGGSAIDVSEAFSAIKTHLSLSSFSLSSSHFSPLNNDQDAGEMSYEEKYKLVLGLMSLPAEKYFQASQIMRKRNIELKQLDLDALDKETLWELDRFVADYEGMASEPMRPALMGTGNDMFTVANNSNERNGNVLASASNTNEMPTGSTLDADEGLEKVHFSVPVVGMEFYSEEEACNFYKCYAQRIGFKVRKGKVQRLSSGDVKKRYFFCSREGFRLKKQSNKKTKYNRKETRTGCDAKMECTVKDGKWVISQFSEKHNHRLGDQIIVESQAKMSEAPLVICSNNGAEMGKDAEATKFVKSCIMDRITHVRAASLQSEDAQNLINYLRRLQAEDLSFFHAVQLDADCRLKNFFWRDGRAKVDYGYFGDLIILDTSFKLDKYDMICAPFLGINHHRQFILFGCAFLLDESTESFIWLLETFMEAMGGNQPKTIVTDEGRAMGDAVKLKLPKAQHQIGLWYIRQNAVNHLSTYFEQPGFKRLFNKCISGCETEEEFESTWTSLFEKFNLQGNEWLVNLRTSRNQWCHIFSRKTFNAGIQCDARIESIFQNLTGQDDAVSLSTFVKQYLRAAEQQRREELHEDLCCREAEADIFLDHCTTGTAEKQVADAYTSTMFKVFQKQLPTLFAVSMHEVTYREKFAVYKLSEVGKKKAFFVEFNCFDSTLVCSCGKYESDGILCVHALKVLNERNIFEIPPQYILKRWTKSAKDCVETVGHVGTADGPNRRFDVNRLSAGETEEGSLLSSPNGTMLRKELLALLEESFKEHNTLTYMQELALAKKLNLRPGIVKMWFQNRRAREKWNQAEMDREYLKRCCEMLAEGNRRLQKELQEKIKDLETVTRFQLVNSTTTEPMCPSRERLATAASSSVAAATTTTCANPIAITPSPSTL